MKRFLAVSTVLVWLFVLGPAAGSAGTHMSFIGNNKCRLELYKKQYFLGSPTKITGRRHIRLSGREKSLRIVGMNPYIRLI